MWNRNTTKHLRIRLQKTIVDTAAHTVQSREKKREKSKSQEMWNRKIRQQMCIRDRRMSF